MWLGVDADMEKLIYKVTKPYIHEGLIATGIDAIMAVIAYVVVLVCYPGEYLGAIIFPAAILLLAAICYAPQLIKCLLDRKKQVVVEKTGVYLNTYNDLSLSSLFRLKGDDSLLTAWYYPKEWNMLKVKPAFRTQDGKVFKPRCILSYAHDQELIFLHIDGIQEKSEEPILLKVKYLKYSKAILSIQMVSWPHDMKRRTKDYIDKNLSDILRWTIKV